MLSVSQKKNPNTNTVTITTDVVDCTSFRVGVTTFFISARTSLRNRVKFSQTPSAFPDTFESAPGCCRFMELSSPFLIADSVAILQFLRDQLLEIRDQFGPFRSASPFDLCSLLSVLYLLNLAGAEGFEPPSSVLETDSLTVELTPLFSGVSDQS